MMTIPLIGVVPLDVVRVIASWPPFSFVFAVVAAGAIAAIRANRTSDRRGTLPLVTPAAAASVRSRHRPEQRTLGLVAVVIVLASPAEFLVRGYLVDGPPIWWWRFAVPIAIAAVGIAAASVAIATRGSMAPEVTAGPSPRRTWLSFSSVAAASTSAACVVVLVATTVAAGWASSADEHGNHVRLTIPVPNAPDVDPLRLPFYGWTYGVPVLIALAALVVVAWRALDRNAARPFLRPDTVAAERIARRRTASGVLTLVGAGSLLSLASAWRLIGESGGIQWLTEMGSNGDLPYDASWRFAEFASLAGYAAPVLEVVALTGLLLAAGSLVLGRRVSPTAAADRTPDEAMRELLR